MAKLCAAGVQLRDQINEAWPKRDKASDGWIGDTAHQGRVSDHNPDAAGWVHAIDVDEDFGDPGTSMILANQLIAYARSGKAGSKRLKYVVYEDRIASGTYKATNWQWRGSGFGHQHHIHVSFTSAADDDGRPFPLQVFTHRRERWDGTVPPISAIQHAAETGAKTTATWRLACRLDDLGAYAGEPLPKTAQGYPINALQAFQASRGLPVGAYTTRTHLAVFGAL